METLRTLYGADPREVWAIFSKYGREPRAKNAWKNEYPKLPEPHPAYSQWRMRPRAAGRLLKKIGEKRYKRVCFLGCPVLGMEFAAMGNPNGVLLDIDGGVLAYARKSGNAVRYDAHSAIPARLKGRFDCTVIDPPWYYDDVRLFIARACALTKKGGTIYSSLPGLLTRPAIVRERLDFQKWLGRSGLVVAELRPCVEYEVPPFEMAAYGDIPQFSGAPWRRGDWLKLKKTGGEGGAGVRTKQQPRWLEYSFGRKRVFLRDEKGARFKGEKLRLSLVGGSMVLRTVSKRNPLVGRIDLWSSRNAVLHVDSGFRALKKILDACGKTGRLAGGGEKLAEFLAA